MGILHMLRRLPRDLAIAALGGRTVGARLVVEREGRFLLVRHTYMSGWFHPVGGVDWRESPVDAAIRECAEETGVTRLFDLTPLGAYRHTINRGDDIVIVYGARTDEDHGDPDGGEIAEIRWVDPADPPPKTLARTLELIEAWRDLAP